MIGVTAVMLMYWLILWHAPETRTGRALRQMLVEAPAARLCRITRGDAAVMIVLLIAAGMIAFVGEGDGIRILTLAAPDVAVWLTAFEVSAYVDIIVAIAVAASNLRVRAMAGRTVGPIFRKGRGRRATRSPSPVERTVANDDDDQPLAFAA